MKLYKIKHKPTGLYYSPSPARLTKRGKIYQTAYNMMSYYTQGYVPMKIDGSYCKLFEGYKSIYGGRMVYVPITEFEIEYI